MKKTIAFIMALSMLLFVGCSGNTGSTGGNKASTSTPPDSNAATTTDFPTHSIRVIVPYGAGGNSDLNTRKVVEIIEKSDFLPESMAVVNINGGNTNEACDTLRASDPDGYTIMLHQSSMISMHNLGTCQTNYYDMLPLIEVSYQPGIMVATPDAPFNNVEELLAYANANPGELIWAWSGIGGSAHLGSICFWNNTGSEALFTPMNVQGGAETIAALLGGHAQIGTMTSSEAAAYIKSGEFKAICVTSNDRLDNLPDTECFSDLGFELSFVIRQGFFAPIGTPDDVVEILCEAITKALETEEYAEFCSSYNLQPSKTRGAEWTEQLALQDEEFAVLVKDLLG